MTNVADISQVKHITDIPQAVQGMGLFDLVVLVGGITLVSLLVSSLIASWLMAVICRTILRHRVTTGSCFSAYWLSVLASFACGLVVGLWQAVMFYGVKGEVSEWLPLWNLGVMLVLSVIVSVVIFGLKIKDEAARHLGLLRAAALVIIQPLVAVGLIVFVVWSIEMVWAFQGLEPMGLADWLKEAIRQKLAS